jgi:hypothetical protein
MIWDQFYAWLLSIAAPFVILGAVWLLERYRGSFYRRRKAAGLAAFSGLTMAILLGVVTLPIGLLAAYGGYLVCPESNS